MSSRPDDAPTMATAVTAATMSSEHPHATAPRTPESFAPGTILSGRYRLVALLGRGGMGEVYRAEDLTLEQPVALKFLPEGVAAEGPALAQFHNELRTARQIAHKNVCRLYDIGEAGGRRFLTMEYVDGEDLASLLRRIGRIPPDKATDIARQLCAGLAAAHDRGVVHRDLKPANVMLDGEGNVRVTDFGLAVAAKDAAAASKAGTPHYMAPEQFTGTPASIKTDIYALGLVLFEIFTGKRAHSARTLHELLESHQSGTITSPRSLVTDLDPAIERVILRCLSRDPETRPGSALAVAAALPGGDPLAAALAAGETPSPEVVAAAGHTTAIAPAVGLSLLAAVILGVVALAAMNDRTALLAQIPLERPLDALEDRAREMVERFGYTARPADTARGVLFYNDYIRYVQATDRSPARWDRLASGDFPAIRFWYRTSPTVLVSRNDWRPGLDDPPLTTTGMTSVVLDTKGRLTQFLAVPPQVDDEVERPSTNWTPLFEAAGLPLDSFQPTTPRWTPSSFADERFAWQGGMPSQPDVRIRVEGASYRGRPVFFRIIGPWTVPTRQASPATPTLTSRVLNTAALLVGLLIMAGAVSLAWRNLTGGRGDLQGSIRLVVFVLGTSIVAWLFAARHYSSLAIDGAVFFFVFVPVALSNAVLVWVIYLAVEPYIRKYGPDMLFSWSRAIAGELRDPRLGRDVLIGIVAGVAFRVLWHSSWAIPSLIGNPPLPPRTFSLSYLLGLGAAMRSILAPIPNALVNATVLALVYIALRAVLGRVWLAAIATTVLSMLVAGVEGGGLPLAWYLPLLVASSTIMVVTLVRVGLLPTTIAFFVNIVLATSPLTLTSSKMYGQAGTLVMLFVIGLAAYGYYAARGTERLFGRGSKTTA